MSGVDARVADALRALPDDLGDDANIATLVCSRHARRHPSDAAVIDHDRSTACSFAELDRRSDAAATRLRLLGVGPRDPVALHLPPGATLLVHALAALKLGAVAMPIATVYGPDGLFTRLRHSAARVLVTDTAGVAKIRSLGPGSVVEHLLDVDQVPEIDATPPSSTYPARPDDPALLLYSSGTSGTPKGVVLAHRLLPALLPGFRLVFDLAPQPGDIYWTPSEWSWLGGLQVVLGALFHGRPVVASSERFSPALTYRILARHGVTGAFLAPAALRRLRAEPPEHPGDLRLRAIMTGGEAYAPEVLDWARETFGCSVNDDYGLTEADDLAVSCGALFETPPGSAGRPLPGRPVAVIDDTGSVLAPGEVGEIAAGGDPIRMLGYWPQPEAGPADQGWFRTGDLGYLDADGFLFVLGRRDDLILVNGYRVSPEEVENQLLRHDRVVDAGVVAVPRRDHDGFAVGACVVLRAGDPGGPQLVAELQGLVRGRLAPHATPRHIAIVDELPRSTTGKTRRRDLLALLTAGRD